MGHKFMHHSRGGLDMPDIDFSDMPSVPMPVAVVGALGSLVLGTLIGMTMSRMKVSNGSESDEFRQRLDELTNAKKHHHHGEGGTECSCGSGGKKSHGDADKHKH